MTDIHEILAEGQRLEEQFKVDRANGWVRPSEEHSTFWGTHAGTVLARVREQAERITALEGLVEEFWRECHLGHDIEPREFFEENAPKDGWSSPIAMALHHIWKRDTKVKNLLIDREALQAQVTSLTARVQELENRDAVHTRYRGWWEALKTRRNNDGSMDGMECCAHAGDGLKALMENIEDGYQCAGCGKSPETCKADLDRLKAEVEAVYAFIVDLASSKNIMSPEAKLASLRMYAEDRLEKRK